MKRHWFVAIACLLLLVNPTSSYSQVPSAVFPIGGFEEGVDNAIVSPQQILDKLKEGKMNTIYHLSGFEPEDAALSNLMQHQQASYITWGGAFQKVFIGDRFGHVYGGEKRFFLVTGEKYAKFDPETEQRDEWWTTLVRDVEQNNSIEWRVKGAGKQLVLEWDGRDASTAADGKGLLHEMRVTGKLVFDFVYALTEIESGNIVTVKIEAFDNNNQELTSLERVDQVTYTDFQSELLLSASEKISLQQFNDRQYAVHRIGGSSHALELNAVYKIKITITSNTNEDVYIRGIRARTDMADKILRDDPTTVAAMKAEFLSIYNLISAQGPYAWKRTPVIGICGEMTYPGYRVLAHIDNLFHSWSLNEAPVKAFPGKRFYTFIAENAYSEQYARHRSIYEDENGYPPPALIAEQGLNMYYQSSWEPNLTMVMPIDGMPYKLRGAQNYVDFSIPLSTKGNCWDNAPAESLFKTLKHELTDDERYTTREDARRSIFEFVEIYYNRQRMHSAINYQTPSAFEATFTTSITASKPKSTVY